MATEKTELTKFEGSIAENLAQALIKRGKMRLTTLHTDIKPTGATGNQVFLLDVSGSTRSRVKGISVHEHMKKAIDEFPQIRRVSFSDEVWLDEVKEPQYGTDMATAFKHLAGLGHDAVILISDGLPNNEEAAIAEAVALGVPVSIVFIGDTDHSAGQRGEDFMKRLAEATGGQQFTSDTKGMQLLSTSLAGHIRGLLGTGSGPILL